MYSDFDERLQSIENKGGGADQPATESAPGAAGAGDAETKASDSQSHRLYPRVKPTPVNKPKPASPTESAPVDNQAPKPKSDTEQVSASEKQELLPSL